MAELGYHTFLSYDFAINKIPIKKTWGTNNFTNNEYSIGLSI